MIPLLFKATTEDYAFLVERIDSYVNLTSDKELKSALADYQNTNDHMAKVRLVRLLEREIRYLGSADIAYAFRKMTSDDEVAGVSFHEIVDDVSEKLKVKQRLVGSVEAKVERVVRATVEKTFFSLTPEQQRDLFRKAGVDKAKQDEIFQGLARNKTAFLPLLFTILGPELTLAIVQGLAISALAVVIGRKAAEALIKNLVGRVPWLAQWLGPIVWTLSLGWLAVDLQGSAFRKTIPIVLYLGIIGLRDGPEEGEGFWQEA